MPCRYGATPEHRIMTELVEADFEIGFSLVDLAAESPVQSARLISDAEDVYRDILARLKALPPAEGESFEPLVVEFRRAIDQAPIVPGR
jgi:hypothetical protein